MENPSENLFLRDAPAPSVSEGAPLQAPESAERVAEVVGEAPKERVQTQKSTAKTDKKQTKKQGIEPKVPALPTVAAQQKAVKKAVQSQIRTLRWQAFFLRVVPGKDPSVLEGIILKIRSLRHVLRELAHSAKEHITELYHQFVLRSSL